MAADRETYRGDLSGVPEDLHGPLSSLDLQALDTPGVGNKMEALLSYIAACYVLLPKSEDNFYLWQSL